MSHDIIEPLLQHIQAECPIAVTVDEAWFAEPLDHFDEQCPAVLVYLAEERPTGDPETIRARQPIRLIYGVWLVCRRADFRAARDQLKRALMGHVFSQQHDVMLFHGGKTDDIKGDLIWWREFWATDTHYSRQQ